MAKARSPFLVTVATLVKRAYKYIPEKHGGLHQHQAASLHRIAGACSPAPVLIPVPTKGSVWSCAEAEFQMRVSIDFNSSAIAGGVSPESGKELLMCRQTDLDLVSARF